MWPTPAEAADLETWVAAPSKKETARFLDIVMTLRQSTTVSAPTRESSRPAPVLTSTPVAREAATTSWPRWRRDLEEWT